MSRRFVFPAAFALALTVGLATTASATRPMRGDVGGMEVPVTPPTGGGGVAKNPTEAQDMGVKWLLGVQHADGGWGAGVWGTDNAQSPSDVATTAYVVLALLRDAKGTTEHQPAVEKGIEFVVRAVETAPAGSPRLNTPEGTQIQYKLGQLVDTHMAALMFGEVYGTVKLPSELNHRVGVAYDDVLTRVQAAQTASGSFDGDAWAPVLSSSIAARSLYRAEELGREVDDGVLAKAAEYQGSVAGGTSGDGAGVQLYSVATSLATNDATVASAERKGKAGAAKEAGAYARDARAAIAADADGRMAMGFGSFGGEEMLSYQMISDTLAKDGGEGWTSWNERVGGWLVGAQSADGSWAGHHCITSSVFVTAGAVMTLSAGDEAALRAKRTAG